MTRNHTIRFIQEKAFFKAFLIVLLSAYFASCSGQSTDIIPTDEPQSNATLHLVFVSDSHYGLFRQFDGASRTAEYVNAVMAETINTLPGTILPADGGIGESTAIEGIEMIVHGGDVANRQETGIQSAEASWAQFRDSFIRKINTKTAGGKASEFFVIPGNHDVSNAIGYYKPMSPEKDATAIAEMYNMMAVSGNSRTAEDYNYSTDKIYKAAERFGILFLFINIWPGAEGREWIGQQIDTSSGIPAIIFAHDPPAIESKHFTNPYYPHNVEEVYKYENLVTDMPSTPGTSLDEQREMAGWLALHNSIKAYFHGHTNYNEFYTFTGPDNNVLLPTFRVDSPMKGKLSSENQNLVSFHVISIDTLNMKMTVRECFYGRGKNPEWGIMKTISLE